MSVREWIGRFRQVSAGRIARITIAVFYALAALSPVLSVREPGAHRDALRSAIALAHGARVAAYVCGAPLRLALVAAIAMTGAPFLAIAGVTVVDRSTPPPNPRLLGAGMWRVAAWVWTANAATHVLLAALLVAQRRLDSLTGAWVLRLFLGTSLATIPYAMIAWCALEFFTTRARMLGAIFTIIAAGGVTRIALDAKGAPTWFLPASPGSLALSGPLADLFRSVLLGAAWVIVAIGIVWLAQRGGRRTVPGTS